MSVRPVQPHTGTKQYRCPGCEGTIGPAVFHLVVIPEDVKKETAGFAKAVTKALEKEGLI